MGRTVILASASPVRQDLLGRAGLAFEVIPARIDEQAIKDALVHEGATPRDIADALAEFKARRVSEKHADALVIGCDQVLDLNGRVLSKPETRDDARDQLCELRARRHALLSAAVIYDGGKPVWRHVGKAQLTMRPFSDAYLDDYLTRNWESVRHTVGCYKLEEEGIRLFTRVEGDYFVVLGLPLLEILSHLTTTGILKA